MKEYLQIFHQMKDLFLKFRTSKATRTEANCHDRELREIMATQWANALPINSAAQRRRHTDQEKRQRNASRADFIQRENHFNFINMHYFSHFESHVQQFGSISMHSMDIGKMAHKEQIKEGYWLSNKNEAAQQILLYYGHQYALGIRL